jgi:hypothetical protein
MVRSWGSRLSIHRGASDSGVGGVAPSRARRGFFEAPQKNHPRVAWQNEDPSRVRRFRRVSRSPVATRSSFCPPTAAHASSMITEIVLAFAVTASFRCNLDRRKRIAILFLRSQFLGSPERRQKHARRRRLVGPRRAPLLMADPQECGMTPADFDR